MSPLEPGPRHQQAKTYVVSAALFDIDNTLVSNNSPDLPTERFRSAVQAARGRIRVGLATARPLSKVAHILDYIAAGGLSILCNGAQIINNADRSVVAEWAIDLATCAELLAYISELGVTYWINDDGADYFASAAGDGSYERLQDIWDQDGPRVPAPGYRPAKPFVIVLHQADADQAASVERIVRDHPDADVTTLTAHEYKQADGSFLYDMFVVHKRANKKDALHEVARLQGLPQTQVMAVGDGRNDAVIVAEAGVGVAMGNAASETLAVATYVAPGCDADGAAVALEFAAAHLV